MTSVYSFTSADNARTYGIAWVQIDPAKNDNAVRARNVQRLTVEGVSVPGGSYAVIDLAKCQDVEVRFEEAEPQGEYGMVISQCERVYVMVEKLRTHGRVCDALVDGQEVELNLVAHDLSPIRVIALSGEPTYRAGSGPYIYSFAYADLGWLSFVGYVLGPLMAYANPRWLGRPWAKVYGLLSSLTLS